MAILELGRTVGAHGFEKYVAVKRIAPKWADDPEFITMFLDEARLAAVLDHPNVVRVHDLGHDARGPFFVMDYIHGEDLVALRSAVGGPLPVEHVLSIGSAAAAGLHHAHTRRDFEGRALKIVHRDVSPSNVLVTYDGGVKLVDFGIAKATRADGTRPSIRKGKIGYMSPEQCKGSPMDGRSDVFSLGVVLWELLAGMRLFGGGDNEFAAMNRIVNHDAPPLSEANGKVPLSVADVIHKALARNPDDRFEDARAMALALEQTTETTGRRSTADDLTEFMRGCFGSRPYPWEPSESEFAVPSTQPGTDPTRVAPADPPRSAPRPSGRRLSWVLLGGALACVGLVALWARPSVEPAPKAAGQAPAQAPTVTEPAPATVETTIPRAPDPAPEQQPLTDPGTSAEIPDPPPKPAPKTPKLRTRKKAKAKTAPDRKKPEPSPAFDPDGLGPVRTVLK